MNTIIHGNVPTNLPSSAKNFWEIVCTPTTVTATCHRCGMDNLEVRASGGARYAMCPTHGILTLYVPAAAMRQRRPHHR